jgi:hydrogenase nickel incorporation protein HypA/HybF
MHELSLAQAIVDVVVEEAHKAQARKVCSVTLILGELSGVVEEQLLFCLPMVAKDTTAEGAELHVVRVEGEAFCASCERSFHMTHLLDPCPRCGAHSSDVRAGRELSVGSLQVE